MSVTVFKGNLSPSLFDTIRQAGVPFDLAGCTVKLQARTETVGSPLEIDAAASVIATATTLSADTELPTHAIAVASTTGFLSAGALTVGDQIVEYDEISGNTFLGCRGGDGTVASGAAVSQRGGVRYDWVAGDVDTVLELVAWWEVTLPSAKVQETPTFQVFVIDPQEVSQALCEPSDVFAYAPGYTATPQTQEVIRRLILARTRQIQQETAREVRAISPAQNTRRFDVEPAHLRSRTIRIGDAATVSTVKLYDPDQATLQETVASTDYVLQPRTRSSWEPATAIYFPPSSPARATLVVGGVLEVVGTWGFPSVPDDLREACAQHVVVDYVTNPANVGTSFFEALEEVNIGALFASSRRVIVSYQEPLVA